MTESDKLKKEVGSLAGSIRARLVSPAESLEARVAAVEKKVVLLSKVCILVGAGAVLSLGSIVYLLTSR